MWEQLPSSRSNLYKKNSTSHKKWFNPIFSINLVFLGFYPCMVFLLNLHIACQYESVLKIFISDMQCQLDPVFFVETIRLNWNPWWPSWTFYCRFCGLCCFAGMFRGTTWLFFFIGFVVINIRYGPLRIFFFFKRKTLCYKKEIAFVIWGHMWKSFQVETLSRDELASRLTLTVDSASVKPLLLSDLFITIMDVSSLKLTFYRLCTLLYLKYACRSGRQSFLAKLRRKNIKDGSKYSFIFF